jgi:hypothetical protein
MSENGHDSHDESESMKAARSAPPLPDNEGRERVDGPDTGFSPSTLTVALPLLVSIAGAFATSLASKSQRDEDARHTHDEDDEGWLESAKDLLLDAGQGALSAGGTALSGGAMLAGGAKAAGVAGLLKAIGSGKLSDGAMTAAKAVAVKKLGSYLASAATGTAKTAARHPVVTGAGTAAALKARSAAQTGYGKAQAGYGRARDAAVVLRHGRSAVAPTSNPGSSLATGAVLLGIGAAALYLFDPTQGADRRKELRDRVMGLTGRK